MILKADLHIHSCLSPCGSLEMSPGRIVREAQAAGIGILALTDHNSAMNCPPFGRLCRKAGIVPIFGVEATTREEVHVLCLYGSEEEALALGEFLYRLLPGITNDPARFGDQVYVDENESILGVVGRALAGACGIGLDELSRHVTDAGGLFVPAHVDRPVFSMESQLGFIPEGEYSALEITSLPCPPHPGSCPCISSSDAHYPGDIGKRAFGLECRERSFRGVSEAIAAGRITLPPLPRRMHSPCLGED